jgi:hypothetical protein
MKIYKIFRPGSIGMLFNIPDLLKLFLLIILFFISASCDILRFSRFEVISWVPGSGYHPV